MAKPVPAEIIDFIETGSKFLVGGHEEPDGDCVGSQLALVSALRRLGKEAIPCSAGPFKRTEIMPYADRFMARPGEKEREGARVIVTDCSGLHRTGDLEPCLKGLPLALIDHHITGDHPAGALIFLDPHAPSVTFMILGLIEALGLTPTAEEAAFLLFGLCTDTGFFRHADDGGAETFAYASRMIQAGANPKKVFQAINGGKSLNSRKLMGLVLSRAEEYFDGRLILSSEEYEETQAFGLEGRDSDMIYQLLQSVAGVEAVAVIRQESPVRPTASDGPSPGKCAIGFRSRDQVDVSLIAASFGGGGHKNAAGLMVPGTIAEWKPKILAAFEKVFP
ncbi:phosphoesterase [Spirochaetia bacterium]|nr:phosphoesterase [Spirochaetia bacterium]